MNYTLRILSRRILLLTKNTVNLFENLANFKFIFVCSSNYCRINMDISKIRNLSVIKSENEKMKQKAIVDYIKLDYYREVYASYSEN